MKPFRNLAETRTPDGSKFSLHEHDGDYFLKLNGKQLMSTTSTTSELLLAHLPCKGLPRLRDACVLIGGLGLGYSLQRVLELARPDTKIQVAELLPDVVAWNREFLRGVNGKLLDDPRVEVLMDDVFKVIRRAGKAHYDAILLDVDNGPTSHVQRKNSRLYDPQGFSIILRALKPGAKVAFWSAVPEPEFAKNLSRAGFKVEEFPAKSHERAKREAHMIYVGQREPEPEPSAADAKPSVR